MKMQPQQPPERREQDRHIVRWPVHVCGKEFDLLNAEVCDITSRGMFVHLNGEVPLPVKGSRLMLTVFPNGMDRGVQAVGTVRWSGQSRSHRCRGFGILVEHSAPFLRLRQLAVGEAAS